MRLRRESMFRIRSTNAFSDILPSMKSAGGSGPDRFDEKMVYGKRQALGLSRAAPETLELSNEGMRIEGVDFFSPRLQSQLSDAQSNEVMLVAASAGKQCEERARQLWNEEKPDEYFFMEVYGSAVVENLIMNMGARFCEWADQTRKAILPHYSPGYPGWEISDQDKLLSLILRKKEAQLPEEIRVLDSGMLQPKKSLLAVFGITSNIEKVKRLTSLIPCDNCSLESCQYRRLPYKNSIPQIEDIRKLQSGGDNRGTSVIQAKVLP